MKRPFSLLLLVLISWSTIGCKETPEDPIEPNHPELLTWIEVALKPSEQSSDEWVDWILFGYDAEGRVISCDYIELDDENPNWKTGHTRQECTYQTDRILSHWNDRYVEKEEGEYYLYEEEDSQLFTLNADGRVSGYSMDGEQVTFSYNTDGTLASTTFGYEGTMSYAWENGNLSSASFYHYYSQNFTYTQYENRWCGVEIISSLFFGDLECCTLADLCGMRSKNLPAGYTYSDSDQAGIFEYTFDSAGRIATLIEKAFDTDNTQITRYTFHYGKQEIPQLEFPPHRIE